MAFLKTTDDIEPRKRELEQKKGIILLSVELDPTKQHKNSPKLFYLEEFWLVTLILVLGVRKALNKGDRKGG